MSSTERESDAGMRFCRFSLSLSICLAFQPDSDSGPDLDAFMQREIQDLKEQFPDLQEFEPFLKRENRQWNQRRPQMSNETIDDLMKLYVDSVQEMRDASFGPLSIWVKIKRGPGFMLLMTN